MPAADELAAWSTSPGVPSALAAARDAVDSLIRDRGLRRTTPELTAESLLRGAAASALLESDAEAVDAATYDDAVQRLRDGAGDPLAVATARLNADLLALVPVVQRSPLQALARMHALAAAGRVPEHMLGRPRPAPGVAARLQALSRLLAAPTAAPAVAVAALAHAEIATSAPFEAVNGVVARALERLLLVSRGVDPASVTVPEAGHLALMGDYREALAAYDRDPSGRSTWLMHAASALPVGVAASPLR